MYSKEQIDYAINGDRSMYDDERDFRECLEVVTAAYKEAVEALEMLYDYSERNLTKEEIEQIEEIINKAPEDL